MNDKCGKAQFSAVGVWRTMEIAEVAEADVQ
jgi:hypothetical protein